MPSSTPGRWAGRLLLLSVALFGAFFALVASGQRGGETFFSNLWLSATMLPAAVAAVTAGVFGVGALRRRDRSVVVLLAIIVGSFVALFAAAEILLPH